MENSQVHSIDRSTNTGAHIALSSPAPQLPSGLEVKQTVRIIKDLARDIEANSPKIKTPSSWLLRNIVQSHYCTMTDVDWRTTTAWTLTHIALSTSPTRRRKNRFIEASSRKALFPNAENFSLGDLHQFSTTLLDYLNTHSTHH